MDILYYIESRIAFVLYKLGIGCTFLSRENIILRFTRRFCKQFNHKNYNYANDSSKNLDAGLKEERYIFYFWAQGEEQMPAIIKTCYNSILRNKGNNKVILLDTKNISQYINLPEYILEKLKLGEITLTHFSDILRFALLAKFGGWWIDATIFLNGTLPVTENLFTIKNRYSQEYISENRWAGFIWHLPKNHPLAQFVYDVLKKYWEKNNLLIEYLFLDYIIKVFSEYNTAFNKELNELPITNEQLYFLQNEGNDKYDEKRWREVCASTYIFKNSWKKEIKTSNNGNITFYGKILESHDK